MVFCPLPLSTQTTPGNGCRKFPTQRQCTGTHRSILFAHSHRHQFWQFICLHRRNHKCMCQYFLSVFGRRLNRFNHPGRSSRVYRQRRRRASDSMRHIIPWRGDGEFVLSSLFTVISPSFGSTSETKQSNSLSRIPKIRSLASGTFWEKSLLDLSGSVNGH